MLLRRLAFILLVACVALSVHAQPQAFRVQALTTADGLPSNYVYCILEDRQGFLWLGTEGGLVRYDGYTFTQVLPSADDSTHFGSNGVTELFEDDAGDLWIGGDGGGLLRYNQETGRITRFLHDPDDPGSLTEGTIRVVYESLREPGVLWVGTGSLNAPERGGLSRLDASTGTITPVVFGDDFQSITATTITVHEDHEGTLWFGSWGLHRYDRTTDSFSSFWPDPAQQDVVGTRESFIDRIQDASENSVLAVHEDSEGLFWLGTERGLLRFNPQDGSFAQFLPVPDAVSNWQNAVNSIEEDPYGRLWIGGQGLILFDRTSERFIEYPVSVSTQRIAFIHEDRFGEIWVGNNHGLLKLGRPAHQFTHYRNDPDDANSLGDNHIRGIAEDRNGNLWFGGAEAGGITRLALQTGRFTQYRPNPDDPANSPPAGVTSIYEDRAGVLWMGTCVYAFGLSQYDPGTGRFTSYRPDPDDPTGLSSGCVNNVVEDRLGALWIATWGGGLNRLDRASGRFTHFRHDPDDPLSLGNEEVTRLYMDRSETIWVGTMNGLSRFDIETETFTNYFATIPYAVTTILEDQTGGFWIGTTQGLHEFDRENGTTTVFGMDEGLVHPSVSDIVEDDNGYLWISTEGGLSRFNLESYTFTNFTTRDGLPGNFFTSPAALKSSSGALVFAGRWGAVSFFPEQIRVNDQPPQVALTSVHIADAPGTPWFEGLGAAVRKVPDALTLAHDQNDLAFEYVGLHFVNSERNQYQYRLEPYDQTWIQAGAQRSARYTNLSPGDYVFRVKASNSDGLWNEEGASIHVTIRPPWWRTTWAYVLYGLLFLGGVFSVDRVQRRRVVAREREKARARELEQAREIERAYHELRQTKDRLVQQEKMASLGQLTAGIAHEIKNPLNFINNFAELNAELADEVENFLSYGHDNPSELQHDSEPPVVMPLRATPSAGASPSRDDALDALQSLKQNAQAIAQHGKRADGIVHAMMQHASGGTGQREARDLNALISEYIDLAYHGKRAQVKGFTVDITRTLDPKVGMVEVVPQDIGRVLLNLFGNAFDAMHEYAPTAEPDAQGRLASRPYGPRLKVSSHQKERHIEIRIEDNGPGIPAALRDRIFEPFFTTKSTGSGTGLGLSLSYDIVTQGHGGTLTVESEEGEGATFIVTLPLRHDAAV